MFDHLATPAWMGWWIFEIKNSEELALSYLCFYHQIAFKGQMKAHYLKQTKKKSFQIIEGQNSLAWNDECLDIILSCCYLLSPMQSYTPVRKGICGTLNIKS